MVDLSPEPEWLPVDDGVALLAHVLPHPVRLHLRVALVAQRPALRSIQQFRVTATISPPQVTATISPSRVTATIYIDTLGHNDNTEHLRAMANISSPGHGYLRHSGSQRLYRAPQGHGYPHMVPLGQGYHKPSGSRLP
jgi:hypothetical protein